MLRWQRQGLGYAALLVGSVAFFVVIYHLGMVHLEGRASQSVFVSLLVVVETFTTIGYGSQGGWSSPAMNLLVVLMDLTSFVVVFMALPLVVVPLLRDALETSPPAELELSDHVLICGFTSRGETLIEELDAWETAYGLVIADRETARELHADGHPVVHGDPESGAVLRRANAAGARAIVADADDQTNASIVLAAREVADDARVVATAQDPDDTRYLKYAGADAVLTPRHLLGRSLAEKVTLTVAAEFEEGSGLSGDIEVVEVPVEEGSEVAGRQLGDSGIRERTGANVVGAWRRGEFVASLDADDVVAAGSVLLVAGNESQVDHVRDLTQTGAEGRTGQVVVIGYGEVGRTVAAELAAGDVPYTVIDRRDVGGADIVGGATDETALVDAGVESARAVILAIPDDTTTAFATLVVRELDEEVEIVARADETDAEQRLYLAGADYVLSLATVSGRMIASEVLDEDVITPDKQVEVVKLRAPTLAGQRLDEANIGERTGCTVIAVERGGETLTELGPAFEIEADDKLVIAGSDESVRRFGSLSH